MEMDVRTHDALISPDDYARLPRHPLYLVLDNLRSAFNVGAIFRLADTARIKEILLCGCTAYPPHLKLEKTAMGTIPYVNWQHYAQIDEALIGLKQKGVTLLALETTEQSESVYKYSFPQPCALIFGNEALGVSAPALKMADRVLEIPLFGFKNSLNVATAAGIVAFEALRQWKNSIAPVRIFRETGN